MANRWGLAFVLSASLALVAAAFLRNTARRPGPSSRTLRRSGGVVLLASLVGWAIAPDRPRVLVATAAAMVAISVAGWFADRGALRGRYLPLTILAISIVPVAAGARAEVIGVGPTDAVLTVLWIAALTSAVAGLGNTDGLLAEVTAAASAGVFGLAAFGDQDALATVAVALGGACVGFLAYNLRPASLFIGQAGSLPVGAALAVASIEIRPAIEAPQSFAVPLILLALPIVDAVMVALGRVRHRKPLVIRRADHIPHRLRGLGWRNGLVVSVLAGLQLVLSGIAVFVGRGVLDALVGGGIAAVLVATLALVAVSANVYRERADGPSTVFVLVGVVLGLAAAAVTVPTILAGIEARDLLTDGRSAAKRAISAARRGEPDVAAQRFEQAAALFGDARDKLGTPIVTPALAVPVLGSNLYAARELSDAGFDLARAGVQLTQPVDPEKLRLRGGTIDLAEVERITPSLEEAAVLLSDTAQRVEDINTAFLVGPVRDAIDEIEEELVDTEQDAVRGAAAARIGPALLGADGPRRYFLAIQNPAELRATGGFIGSWGILTAANGTIDLEFIEPIRVLNAAVRNANAGTGADGLITGPQEYLDRYSRFEPALTWQNVNMSPDFPVVAQVIEELYPKSGGEEVDGVIAVDPVGLQAVLELTGPVRVEGWPEPVTAQNVLDIMLRQAYETFDDQSAERQDFLGDVAEEVFDVATEGDLGRPGRIADVLGRASRQGHISLYLTRDEEQAIAELVNAEGSVPRTDRDSLMVVTQNAAANKIDYYLRRHVSYSMQIDPSSTSSAWMSGTIDVGLENTAPSSLLPQSVIGPAEGLEGRFVAGQNFAYVSVYTPSELAAVRLDGAPTEVVAERELGRNVFSTFVNVFSQSTTTISLDVNGSVRLGPDGWYSLQLVRQPFLNADDVAVDLEVPRGWRIAEAEGLAIDGRHARGQLTLQETTTVRLRLEPSGGQNLWEQLHFGG